MEDYRTLFKPTTTVNPTLCCKLCNYVPISPVECIHCESLYCEDCYNFWKRKKDQCTQNCDGNFTVKQAHRIVKQELSKINFTCPNEKLGCKEQLHIEDIQQHPYNCLYQSSSCSCGWKGIRIQQETHQKSCPNLQIIKCELCKSPIKSKDVHNCIDDFKKQIGKLQEKISDFKDQTQVQLGELRNIDQNENKDIDELKMQIQALTLENQEMKQQLQKLVEIIQEQQKLIQQQNQQKVQTIEPLIKEGQLVESGYTCQTVHKVYYWVNSKGEEKNKTCKKCHTSNTNCRYVCKDCREFYCCTCVPVELTSNPITRITTCPAGHEITRGMGTFRCTVCSQNQIGVAGNCQTCDFIICQSCIQAKRFKQRNQGPDCPVQ